MSVVRVRRTPREPYVVLERAPLRIASLSLKARGLWAVCMSYPDDWEFNVNHLAGVSDSDGMHAVRGGLQELKKCGLAALEKTRNEDGTMGGSRWNVYENPALNPHFQRSDRDTENPDLGDRKRGLDDSDRDGGFPDVGKNRTPENPDVGKIRPNVLMNKDDEVMTVTEKQYSTNNNNPQRLQQGASNEHPKNVVVVDEKIVRLLKGRGIAQPQAEQLASEYEPARVQRQLQHLDWLKARGQGPASEPAWLVSAIRHEYGLPPKLQQQIARRQRASAGVPASAGDGQASRIPSAEVSAARPGGVKARPSQEKPSQQISAETAAALSAATAALEGGDQRLQREARLRRQARRAAQRLGRYTAHLRSAAEHGTLEALPDPAPPWPVFYAPEGYLWQLEGKNVSEEAQR